MRAKRPHDVFLQSLFNFLSHTTCYSDIRHTNMILNMINLITTRKRDSVRRANASSTIDVYYLWFYYIGDSTFSLSQLRLRVARLYLHCGISHCADI